MKPSAKILLVCAALLLAACAARRVATIPRPLQSDHNEIHWRMYYENQFNEYGRAAPPPPDAPHAAWTAYYAEKQAYDVREMREEMEWQRINEQMQRSQQNIPDGYDTVNKSMDRSIRTLKSIFK